VISVARCRGGIIAAGEGRRLRATGFSMPKPLVPVAGVPLIEWVIGNFRAAGITSLVMIVNEQSHACPDWVQSRFSDLDVEVIVKTTASSLESFLEINRRLAGPGLAVNVTHELGLAETVRAHELVEAGTRGRVVIRPDR